MIPYNLVLLRPNMGMVYLCSQPLTSPRPSQNRNTARRAGQPQEQAMGGVGAFAARPVLPSTGHVVMPSRQLVLRSLGEGRIHSSYAVSCLSPTKRLQNRLTPRDHTITRPGNPPTGEVCPTPDAGPKFPDKPGGAATQSPTCAP